MSSDESDDNFDNNEDSDDQLIPDTTYTSSRSRSSSVDSSYLQRIDDHNHDDNDDAGTQSRSVSRARSRSRSRSRSNSPETSTRKLFIDSDDSDEDELKSQEVVEAKEKAVEESSDDDDEVRRDDVDDKVSHGNDFDLMMQQKKEENRRRRRKKDIDVINDNDDAIAKMIADMRIAAKEDRDLNNHGRPAVKKIGMLKLVMHNLTKVELQLAFIEANLLAVMTDWLAPMPDKSLPHIMIRNEFLTLLNQLKIDDPSRLKESGIGKAVMYLYRHPRETKENKVTAGHIIHNWARPIFHKEDNLALMTKEDRREKDLAIAASNLNRKKRKSEEVEDAKRPGDPGWIGRARVPQVAAGEYVARPAWQTDVTISKEKKKGITLLEKHKRKFAERKRNAKNLSLSKISIEGARMGLG